MKKFVRVFDNLMLISLLLSIVIVIVILIFRLFCKPEYKVLENALLGLISPFFDFSGGYYVCKCLMFKKREIEELEEKERHEKKLRDIRNPEIKLTSNKIGHFESETIPITEEIITLKENEVK